MYNTRLATKAARARCRKSRVYLLNLIIIGLAQTVELAILRANNPNPNPTILASAALICIQYVKALSFYVKAGYEWQFLFQSISFIYT